MLEEEICVGSCKECAAGKIEPGCLAVAGRGCVWGKPKDRQVRREERCAALKMVYSEMGKQTLVSVPGIIVSCVVTSG